MLRLRMLRFLLFLVLLLMLRLLLTAPASSLMPCERLRLDGVFAAAAHAFQASRCSDASASRACKPSYQEEFKSGVIMSLHAYFEHT